MAAMTALQASVLLRIGDGAATEVATFDVPLRAVLEDVNAGIVNAPPSLVIQVDFASMHENLRAALLEAAATIQLPWPADQPVDLPAEKAALLARWDAFRETEHG